MVIIANKNIKELRGEVISSKMNKTVVVAVKSVRLHPLYQKRFVKTKKYYVHDEENRAKAGDLVVIRQARPVSKLKRRTLLAIEKAAALED